MKIYREAFIRLFFPASCGVCGILLDLTEERTCSACGTRIRKLGYGIPESSFFESWEYLDHAWACFPYKPPVRDIITAVKFNHKPWLIKELRQSLEPIALAISSEYRYDGLMAVPVDRFRLAERGYNPAALAAELVHEVTRIPFTFCGLKKRMGVPPQSGLTRQERLANLGGAFRLSASLRFEGKSLLLVDDVMTTGATANEVARVLKEHGANRVDLLAMAKTEENFT